MDCIPPSDLLAFFVIVSDTLERLTGKTSGIILHIPVEKLHRLQPTMEELLGEFNINLRSLRALVTLAITLLITYVSVAFGCAFSPSANIKVRGFCLLAIA